jgi:2'-5' RNA ligase
MKVEEVSKSSDTVKIGINFPIREPTLSECLRINADVFRQVVSHARFGQDGNSSPHVTIAMGTVPAESVNALIEQVRKEVTALPAQVPAVFGRPVRETTTGRYIVASVTLPPEINTWRSRFRELVGRYFLEQARTTEDAHLTLAVLDSPVSSVDGYLARLGPLSGSSFSQLDVSIAGSKGVKAEVLAVVPLG